MKNNTIVLYHHDCFDGFASAAVMYQAYGEHAQYIPIEFHWSVSDIHANNKGPVMDLVDTTVYLVDVHLPPASIRELAATAREVIIIDHHAGAISEYRLDELEEELDNFSLCFSSTECGCVTTWRYLYPELEVPMLLQHVQDRDLWTWKLHQTKSVIEGLAIEPRQLKHWSHLISEPEEVARIDERGFLLVKQKQSICTSVAASHWVVPSVFGFKNIPVVNVPHALASETLHLLNRNAPFAIGFTDLSETERKWSIRGNKRYEPVDLKALTHRMGGGGHYSSAGFVTHKPNSTLHADNVGVFLDEILAARDNIKGINNG